MNDPFGIKRDNWHIEYLKKTIERLDERRQRDGIQDITVNIDWLIAALLEKAALHSRLDYYEEIMGQGFKMYALQQPVVFPLGTALDKEKGKK